MPKVMPEYLEQRRQQILDAAAASFARGGFHQTTMQDICDEAGLSPGAVYRYFRSKDEIIQAMCARGHTQNLETIRAAMAEGATLTVFDELIRMFFSQLEDHELCALSIELLSEARRNEFVRESIEAGWQAIRASLAAIISQAQVRGEVDPELDPQAVARVMMAIYQGLLHQKLVEPNADLSGYSAAVKALFHGTFWRGAPAAPEAKPGRAAALRH